MSSKLSTFICQNCGSETSQYFGKCLNCNSWNSIVEEIKSKSSKYQEKKDIKNSKKSIPFNEISSKKILKLIKNLYILTRFRQKKYQDLQVVLENLIEFLEVELYLDLLFYLEENQV